MFEAVPHMPQAEGPATKIYNHVLGGFGEIKQEKKEKRRWQQLLAQVPIFKEKKKIGNELLAQAPIFEKKEWNSGYNVYVHHWGLVKATFHTKVIVEY